MTLSPNLSLSVAMVTMSLADGVCEDPVFAMEWAEDLETGVGPHYQDCCLHSCYNVLCMTALYDMTGQLVVDYVGMAPMRNICNIQGKPYNFTTNTLKASRLEDS